MSDLRTMLLGGLSALGCLFIAEGVITGIIWLGRLMWMGL
jgi:hypothetical protein